MSLLERFPDRWRNWLDNWKPWAIIFGIGLVGVSVATVHLNERTSEALAQQAKAQAIHTAEIRGAARSSYARCVGSIPTLNAISTHLGGVSELVDSLVVNNRAGLEATAKSDPFYQVRAHSLERLVVAQRKIHAIRELSVPTVAQCKRERDTALRELRK